MLPPGFHFLPLPRLFWSAYHEAPFSQCIACDGPLSESPVFVIQKRFVGGEAVFEMAVCEQCRQTLTDSYSVETRQRLHEKLSACFQNNPIVQIEPGQQLPEGEELLRRCMDFCLMCAKERQSCHRYSLAGLFRKEQIVVQCSRLGQSPVMVCDECEHSLESLISKQTRDSWERFMEEHFDGPPGIDLDAPFQQPAMF